MKKKRSKLPLILALMVLVAIFALVTVKTAKATYEKRVQDEQLTELDFYSMQQFSMENSKAIMAALRAGDKAALEKLMPGAAGLDELLAFADWSKADLEGAVSMGAGSLTEAPDEEGKMDISERFIVKVGDTKYVLFIETLTSRWGRQNDGVTAVGATTFEHFDAIDYDWLGKPDEYSILAGELWWDK